MFPTLVISTCKFDQYTNPMKSYFDPEGEDQEYASLFLDLPKHKEDVEYTKALHKAFASIYTDNPPEQLFRQPSTRETCEEHRVGWVEYFGTTIVFDHRAYSKGLGVEVDAGTQRLRAKALAVLLSKYSDPKYISHSEILENAKPLLKEGEKLDLQNMAVIFEPWKMALPSDKFEDKKPQRATLNLGLSNLVAYTLNHPNGEEPPNVNFEALEFLLELQKSATRSIWKRYDASEPRQRKLQLIIKQKESEQPDEVATFMEKAKKVAAKFIPVREVVSETLSGIDGQDPADHLYYFKMMLRELEELEHEYTWLESFYAQ